MSEPAAIELDEQGAVLSLKGHWLVDETQTVDAWIQTQLSKAVRVQTIRAASISRMDTAGAFLLYSLYQKILQSNPNTTLIGLQTNFQSLLDLVATAWPQVQQAPPTSLKVNFFYYVGKKSVALYQDFIDLFAFLGEVFVHLFQMIFKPIKLQWKSMVHEIDIGGYRALPIIAVMMFLIGIVVAYQLGVQLRIYGATSYIVDLSGVAILREFSPLIASVIIAGRTSTSFAALIGTMKVNEEIDALRTMGLSPIERLVLPKILGLLVALPLLVVWGNLFGMIGSMVMAKNMAGITYHTFLERFKQEVAIKHLYIGLVKTPVFAIIIAGIGCYQGFQAEGSAQSVGERTTRAAVQAIFLIILMDGLFSILFNWMDL